MLKFHGHSFMDTALCRCCVGDKRAVVTDPTNTGKLRAKFRKEMRRRWNQMRILTREMLKDRDLLALKSGGLMQVHAPAITGAGSKIDVFQRWFDLALGNAVLQRDGSWMRLFLSEAYRVGTQFGQAQALSQLTHRLAGHREEALVTLARVELEGIIEAVSQQSVRAIAQALLVSDKPMGVVRKVLNIIEKIGVNRSNAMIELLVVRAHAEASLDVYEAAGLASVGLVPESRAQARVVTDAQTEQTAKSGTATEDASGRKGPGSRASRKSVPSSRTISRIRASELRIARALGENVNVRTAGDDDVCPVCEKISENGPYSINTARALIPAHPHCRCVFVPSRRAPKVADTGEGNQNHDPKTGQFTGGGGGSGAGRAKANALGLDVPSHASVHERPDGSAQISFRRSEETHSEASSRMKKAGFVKGETSGRTTSNKMGRSTAYHPSVKRNETSFTHPNGHTATIRSQKSTSGSSTSYHIELA